MRLREICGDLVHAHAVSLVFGSSNLNEAQGNRLAALPTALNLSLCHKLCANWAAGGEAVVLACWILHGQSVTKEKLLEVVKLTHKARMEFRPSAAFTEGGSGPDSTVTEASMGDLWKFVKSKDWCKALKPARVAPSTLLAEFEKVRNAVGGCKVLELCHWHVLRRVRPALAYAMRQSIRDTVGKQYPEDTELEGELLSALFGPKVSLEEVQREEKKWFSYRVGTAGQTPDGLQS